MLNYLFEINTMTKEVRDAHCGDGPSTSYVMAPDSKSALELHYSEPTNHRCPERYIEIKGLCNVADIIGPLPTK